MKAPENYIHIDNEKISVGYTVEIKQQDGWFRTDIRAFNITDFSKTYEGAHEISDASVRSYLNFWLKIMGWGRFREELVKRGFDITGNDIESGTIEAILPQSYTQMDPEVMVVNEERVIYGQGTRD